MSAGPTQVRAVQRHPTPHAPPRHLGELGLTQHDVRWTWPLLATASFPRGVETNIHRRYPCLGQGPSGSGH